MALIVIPLEFRRHQIDRLRRIEKNGIQSSTDTVFHKILDEQAKKTMTVKIDADLSELKVLEKIARDVLAGDIDRNTSCGYRRLLNSILKQIYLPHCKIDNEPRVQIARYYKYPPAHQQHAPIK